MNPPNTYDRVINPIVLVAGLGFFIDMYDGFAFNVIRVQSLTELGLHGNALTKAGIDILNWQIIGTLAGSFLWGILGDKFGRKECLLWSILCYSLGMAATACVHDTFSYAAARFITGFGVAGEVGLGAVLVAEKITQRKRGYALAMFTAFGLAGVAAAGLMSEMFYWRTFCLIGAGMGILLLGARILLCESGLYEKTRQLPVARGRYGDVFATPERARRYAYGILLLVPNFFITGIFLTMASEVGKNIGIIGAVKTSHAMIAYFTCAVLGDFLSSFLTEKLKSRKAVLFIFVGGSVLVPLVTLNLSFSDPMVFYALCGAMGVFNCWALVNMVLSEQCGTNLRSTTLTSSINLSRLSVVGMSLTLLQLLPVTGFAVAASAVCLGAGILALGAVAALKETYGRTLDYQEEETVTENPAASRAG